MKYMISIQRQAYGEEEHYVQDFTYESSSESETVAAMLMSMNEQDPLTTAEGEITRPIVFEHSCMQKKCGACAMVINHRPRLACDARLAEFKDGRIILEPLHKFPVICDLMVDRTILYENLKTLQLWLTGDAKLLDQNRDLAYASSECLQCGCCLEVCPNFYGQGAFFGMATVPLTTRLLVEMDPQETKEIIKGYKKHMFDGCGKSLSCQTVCPRHIQTEKLLVNANALALWKRKRGRLKW